MIQALKTVLPVKSKAKAREKRTILLLQNRDAARDTLEELKRKKYKAKARLLEKLLEDPVLDYTETIKELKLTAAAVQGLEVQGVLRVESTSGAKTAAGKEFSVPAFVLSDSQERAAGEIFREWKEKDRPCLLQGVTGRRKTMV